MSLPACGLYRTTVDIGSVPAGRLVYFHNHGDPGPGVYLPEAWRANRARFSKQGHVLPDPAIAETLQALMPEGLYRVDTEFHCCPKRCRRYSPDMLVQLGFNQAAEPILFLPTWTEEGLSLPSSGQKVDGTRLDCLSRLLVGTAKDPPDSPALH